MYVLKERSAAGDFPRVLLVHMGSVEEGEKFFQKHWTEAMAISDPKANLYRQFGLRRGSFRQILGLRVLLAGMRDLFKGHGVGKPAGDVKMLSGRFLIHRKRILWEDRHERISEGTDYETMLAHYHEVKAARR